VRHADTVLAWSKRLFGSTLTYAAIRHSFYKQFVSGESLEAARATMAELRRHGIGGIAVMEAEAAAGPEAEADTAARREPSLGV
jgi:hypothetical protein